MAIQPATTIINSSSNSNSSTSKTNMVKPAEVRTVSYATIVRSTTKTHFEKG
jgi:hypothetical protein